MGARGGGLGGVCVEGRVEGHVEQGHTGLWQEGCFMEKTFDGS